MQPRPKNKPYRNEKFLKFVRELSCYICKNEAIAHHENYPYGDPSGTGQKTDDTKAIPLCHKCHTLRHSEGFLKFFGKETAPITDLQIALIHEFIGSEYNTDPYVLTVNLLTQWLKEQDGK